MIIFIEQDGVQNLFGHVFGDQSLPENISGDTVTDGNMMMYLGMIEEKTNQLLQASPEHTHIYTYIHVYVNIYGDTTVQKGDHSPILEVKDHECMSRYPILFFMHRYMCTRASPEEAGAPSGSHEKTQVIEECDEPREGKFEL